MGMEKVPFMETRCILESHTSAPPAVSGYTYGQLIYAEFDPGTGMVYRLYCASAGSGAGLWYFEPMTVISWP